MPETHGWLVSALRVLGKDEIHIVTDSISELLADGVYSIQPGDQGVPAAGGQRICSGESLLEYAHQRGEVVLVFISNVAAEPGSLFAIEAINSATPAGSPTALL